MFVDKTILLKIDPSDKTLCVVQDTAGNICVVPEDRLKVFWLLLDQIVELQGTEHQEVLITIWNELFEDTILTA